MNLSSFSLRSVLLCASALCVALSPSMAAPLVWSVNGHSYEYVEAPSISWGEAKALAEAKGAHLATVTSQAENDWIFENVLPSSFKGQDAEAWLGGFQATDEVWQWVTAEAWSYVNWAGGEPNNYGGVNEYLLAFNRYGDSRWNDELDASGMVRGYLVEKETTVPDGLSTLSMLGLSVLVLLRLRRR